MSKISQSNRSHFYFSIISLLCISMLALVGCTLKGKGGGVVIRANDWSANAFPDFVCPNDDVTISWDAGSTPCAAGTGPDCLTFTALSFPTLSPTTTSVAVTSNERTGMSNVGNIDARTTYNFNVTRSPNDEGYRWETKSDIVNYIDDDPNFPLSKPVDFEAVCNEDGIYDLRKFRLNMDSAAFRQSLGTFGECVKIIYICDTPLNIVSMRVTIHSLDGSLPLTTLENRGDCIENVSLNTDLIFEINLSPSEPILDITPRRCLGTVTEPPPIYHMIFYFSCDTESDECM